MAVTVSNAKYYDKNAGRAGSDGNGIMCDPVFDNAAPRSVKGAAQKGSAPTGKSPSPGAGKVPSKAPKMSDPKRGGGKVERYGK